MTSASAHNRETTLVFPPKTTTKLDKLYKAIVFRHWNIGGIELPFFDGGETCKVSPSTPQTFWLRLLSNLWPERAKNLGRTWPSCQKRIENLTTELLKMWSESVSHSVVTPCSVAHRVPLSMEFSRQEYWVGSHSFLQGIFPTQGSKPCRWIIYHLSFAGKPCTAGGLFTLWATQGDTELLKWSEFVKTCTKIKMGQEICTLRKRSVQT